MNDILEKFPKSVLVRFMMERCRFQLRGSNSLEADLLYIQWDQEIKTSLVECDKATAEIKRHHYPDPGYAAARKKYEAANARYNRAERLYERMNKLRGD